MQFVPGLPQGVYVGQTRVHHAKVQPSTQPALAGFNLALHVQDDAQRVQQHRMALLQDFATFGVDKITWMTQTHSTICLTIRTLLPTQYGIYAMLLQDITRNRIQVGIIFTCLLTGLKCTVQFRIFTTKSRFYFSANFKTRLANSCPEPGPGRRSLHGYKGIFNNPTGQTTPTGMQIGNFRTFRISQYHR